MLYLTSDGALQLQEHTAPVFGWEEYREKGRWGEFRDQGRLRKTEAAREGGADCSRLLQRLLTWQCCAQESRDLWRPQAVCALGRGDGGGLVQTLFLSL